MREFEITLSDKSVETWVEIQNGDGFTAMLKSTYDEQQAEAKAPKVVDEAAPE